MLFSVRNELRNRLEVHIYLKNTNVQLNPGDAAN